MARLKIVAHKKSGQIVKGFSELDVPVNGDGVPTRSLCHLPNAIEVHPLKGKPVSIATDNLKAIFFVKSFDGNAGYSETKFFNPDSQIEGLWVHIMFSDGEGTEGIVFNDIGLIRDSGFLMKPPDPQSNNDAIYVMKSALSQFRVVGVRPDY